MDENDVGEQDGEEGDGGEDEVVDGGAVEGEEGGEGATTHAALSPGGVVGGEEVEVGQHGTVAQGGTQHTDAGGQLSAGVLHVPVGGLDGQHPVQGHRHHVVTRRDATPPRVVVEQLARHILKQKIFINNPGLGAIDKNRYIKNFRT